MFQFRQFQVEDADATMKVGTDAVLLGALATCADNMHHILDLGTGCGVIALILAQRSPHSFIDAVDIDPRSIALAEANFAHSPWSHRLHPSVSDIQHFSATPYQLIVSNPPFFQNSLKAPDERRSLARHTDSLPFSDLLFHAARLLSPDGLFECILPCPEAEILENLSSSYGLFPTRRILISNRPENHPVRTILTFSKQVSTPVESRFSIRNSDNTYSHWYRQLTSDLYLHLK